MDVLKFTAESLRKVGAILGLPNVDPESGRIFVTSAVHDVVGYRVVQKLLRAGYPVVRIGVTGSELSGHDSTETDEMVQKWTHIEHAEVSVFDWDLEDTYENALKGVQSVLVCLPYRPAKWYHSHFPKFIQACEKAGVRHIVKLSWYKARQSLKDPHHIYRNVPIVRLMGELDEMLVNDSSIEARLKDFPTMHFVPLRSERETKTAFTILSTGRYMSDPLYWQGNELRRTDKDAMLYGSSFHGKVSYISPNDVAEVAVRTLLEPRAHYDCEHALTNSKANELTESGVAALLSKYLQKAVTYKNQEVGEFSNGLRMSGYNDFQVADMVEWEKVKESSDEAKDSFITSTVQDLCGHEPQSFEEYLTATDDMLPFERA
jgi:uncharacterized protein YbjT (DUF2867 family)